MNHSLRSILVCAMLSMASAQAAVIGTIDNQAGGKINLTDNKGSCPSGLVAIASAPGKEAFFGCWSFDAEQVFIKYEDGRVYVYPSDTVSLTSVKRRQGASL